MINICRNISNYGHLADSIYNVYIVQILWSEIPVSESELNISKAFTNQLIKQLRQHNLHLHNK